ncbi:hypothetical protein CBL16_14975 (plasmid) [Enterococcus faecalis]|nr:hypothetical protein CBL16_14975 [Enterococcus faecalis]
MKTAIKAVYNTNRGIYGYRRIAAFLRFILKTDVGDRLVWELMNELNLKSRMVKKSGSYTDPTDAIYQVVNNLYILPADMSFELYDDWSKSKFEDSLAIFQHMRSRLEPLFDQFDLIYIDVPPSISVYSKSAMYIADWAIVVLQTQVKSMRNAMQYLEYMDFFTTQFDTSLYVAGVIPFMLESSDSVDKEMYEQAKEIYREHLIKNVVLKNARLKRYDGSGITTEKTVKGDLKQWDKKAHELFIRIYEELEEHESWFGE